MDFWRTVVVLFKRWYITVPACFLSLVMASTAYASVQKEYQSDAVLVLTTPLSGGTETTGPARPEPIVNPLLNFEHSLALTASIVIQQLTSSETAVTLGVTAGGPVTYEVDNGTTNPELLESGPIIFIHGTGPSPAAARDIAQRVADAATVILDRTQTALDAPPSTHIVIQETVPPVAGQLLLSSPMRAAAAAAALAGLAALAAAYGFESLMTHRRRRREEKARAARLGSRTAVPDPADEYAATVGVLARRSTHRGHGVNGTASRATPAGAVSVLDRPFGISDPDER
jgi:hypothetical protein